MVRHTLVRWDKQRMPIRIAPKKRKNPGPTSDGSPKDKPHDSKATHREKIRRQKVNIVSKAALEIMNLDL